MDAAARLNGGSAHRERLMWLRDNLNTPTQVVLSKMSKASEARRLVWRLDLCFTLKPGSCCTSWRTGGALGGANAGAAARLGRWGNCRRESEPGRPRERVPTGRGLAVDGGLRSARAQVGAPRDLGVTERSPCRRLPVQRGSCPDMAVACQVDSGRQAAVPARERGGPGKRKSGPVGELLLSERRSLDGGNPAGRCRAALGYPL